MQPDAKLKTQCPNCLKRFSVRPDLLGRQVKCRNCAEPFEVVPLEEVETASSRSAAPVGALRAARRLASVPDFDADPEMPHTPPPLYTHVNVAGARSAWLAPKWIAAAVAGVVALIVAVVLIRGALSGKPDQQATRGGRSRPAPIANDPQSPQPSAGVDAGATPPPKPAAAAAIPELTWSKDDIGRPVGTATTSRRSSRTEVRVVLPPGAHADRSLPCVFICPAGSNLLTGVPWGEDEQRDFYGLLERGLAVCFYTLDGPVDNYETAGDLVVAIKMQAYLKSGGGVGNLQDAIDTVLAGTPAVDSARLGAMGHSSAGTIALTGAGADARVRAVAAMAPAIDLPKRLADVVDLLPAWATQEVHRMSPSSIKALTAEVFLFQAGDDANTPLADAQAFANKHPANVTLKRVPRGGHGGAYSIGRGPGMDFLAAKLRGTPMPGAGKVTQASLSPAAVARQPDRPAVAPAAVPQHTINEAYWYKRRTNGVVISGEGKFMLAADWPEGYVAGKDSRGATFALERYEGKRLGIRVLTMPDDHAPRLVAGDDLLPQADGRVGIDLANQRIVLPRSEPRLLPAMGGGRIAVFDCGDDTERGLPTREAVIAFEYEGRVALLHLAVPREQGEDLDKLIASVRTWGLRGKPESMATPYVTVKAASRQSAK